jgi:hypothetical protein
LDLQCNAPSLTAIKIGNTLRNTLINNMLLQFQWVIKKLRTEGALTLNSMVDSERQSHTEPPAGRIAVFEKGTLIGSFESWRQAVQFIRANHLRRATLVPESHGMRPTKRTNPAVSL